MSRTPSKVARVRPEYGAARRVSAKRSSTLRSPRATIAASCWARTSSGFWGTRVSSTAPSFIALVIAALARRSPRYFGKMTPRETASTWWLARPIRCIPLATDVGVSIWITRSTAPMSIPSSSDEVATRAGRRPALRASSIRRRWSRAIEPWWARATSSPASSLRAAARRSDRRRELTKRIVERCARTSSRRRGWMAGQIERRGRMLAGPSGISSAEGSMASPRRAMSSTGTSTRRSKAFFAPGVDDRHRPRLPASPALASAQVARDLLERPLRRGEADPLEGPPGDLLEPLEREREVGPALRPHEDVDLVHDDRLDGLQERPGPRGEDEEERLRRGDEDVGRMTQHPRPLLGRACRRSG